MRIVVAPDSFKEVLTARQTAEAMACGIRRVCSICVIHLAPMADGGEGTLDILVDAEEGQHRRVRALGPLGEPLEVTVGLIHQASTAVIELASVAGLNLLPTEMRDPLRTSTYGLGQVIRTTIETGLEDIILTIGGSATVDGGAGMMQGIGISYLDKNGTKIPPPVGGGDLHRICRLQWDNPPDNLEHVQFTIACDVLNPACGPQGAAAIFAPQKGADAAAIHILNSGLEHWADLLEDACGRSLRNEPGTGAAGGVALPLLALTSATVVPGVDLVSEAVGLSNEIIGADLVVTGEGCLDRQSMMGKVTGAVGRMCRTVSVSCIAIVGATGDGVEECMAFLDRIYTLDGPKEETSNRLTEVAERAAREMLK